MGHKTELARVLLARNTPISLLARIFWIIFRNMLAYCQDHLNAVMAFCLSYITSFCRLHTAVSAQACNDLFNLLVAPSVGWDGVLG